MPTYAQNTRVFAACLMLTATLQSGCQSTTSQPADGEAEDTAKSIVEIDGEVDGMMGYLDYDGQNRAFYFGQKTAAGEVTGFEAVAVATADGRLFQYLFDEQGRMVQLIDGATTIDITYSDDGETFTLSSDGATEQYALPEGFAQVYDAYQNGEELFASKRSAAVLANRSFSFSTFVKAVALPATAMGGFVAAAAAASTSPILLGLAGVAALGASIKGAIDIAQEATGRPLTPTEQVIREVADTPVLVNDAVSFGVNLSTISRALTRAPNAPSVKEALDAFKDARDGAESLAPTIERGFTSLYELATEDEPTEGQQSLDGCWEVTYTTEDRGESREFWQIENNQLARVWRENSSDLLIEFVRFTSPNASGTNIEDPRQSIAFISGTTGFVVTFSLAIRATLNGESFNAVERNSEVTAAFVNDDPYFTGQFHDNGRVADIDLKEGFQGYEDYDVTGRVVGTPTSCPDASDESVYSQEEYIQALNELAGG